MALPVTPIQRIELPELAARGNRLYVKRDDLLPVAFGGNKVRIALELMEDMEASGCDALIMYGDLRSNLCRVLAFLCHQRGVPSLMVATSENADEGTSFNEDLVRRLGVPVLVCEKGGIAEAIDEAFERLRARGHKPYYIYGDRTGRGNEGTCANAYARAYEELCSQEQELSLGFDVIFVPYGTGCTQGGLVCGSLVRGDGRKIVGISISSRPKERAEEILDATVRDWFEKRGLALPSDYAGHLDLRTSYTCGGYGARDARVDALIEEALLRCALPLDPTYTGKALRGALDYLRDNDVSNASVLFLHTGGTPLFYDYLASTRGSVYSN